MQRRIELALTQYLLGDTLAKRGCAVSSLLEFFCYLLAGGVVVFGCAWRVKTYGGEAYRKSLWITGTLYFTFGLGSLVVNGLGHAKASAGNVLFGYHLIVVAVVVLFVVFLAQINDRCRLFVHQSRTRLAGTIILSCVALYTLSVFSTEMASACFYLVLMTIAGFLNAVFSPVSSAYALALFIASLLGFGEGVTIYKLGFSALDFIGVHGIAQYCLLLTSSAAGGYEFFKDMLDW